MCQAGRHSMVLVLAFLAFTISSGASPATLFGQARVPPIHHHHIRLPASYGATPLSTIIHANAVLTVAKGDFLESAANARLTNSIAAKQEMQNSVEWVRTYFQRKEINRQNTKQPSFIERERKRNQETWNRIYNDSQVELNTDPVDNLNIMLQEMNVKMPSDRFYPGVSDTLVDSQFDPKLSRDDIHRIRVVQGRGGKTGLTFRADDVALKADWPHSLRGKALQAPRAAVIAARDKAVEELMDSDTMSHETSEILKHKLDVLTTAFVSEYPRDRRFKSGATYSEFLAGKKFLQSFAVGVHRTIMTYDRRAFDGSLRFEGDSVADLIAHMHKLGLKFAPRQPGDESVYKKLYIAMRHFSLPVHDESSS